MCKNMDELFAVANQVYELEQKKAKKKKEVDELESQIKALKDEVAVYMKKRQKTNWRLNTIRFFIHLLKDLSLTAKLSLLTKRRARNFMISTQNSFQ